MNIDQLCRAVSSPGELKTLPGYVSQINPKMVGLRRIIWPYHFRSELQCALTNCRAHHKEGVIVELEDGSISNIGHVCGGHKDKYWTKFLDEKLKLSESRLRDEMMPFLLNRAELQNIEQVAHNAYTEGKKWLSRMQVFAKRYPEISAEIARRHGTGASMAVTEVVQRSEKEIENLVESGLFRSQEAARYNEVRKGTLVGTSIFALKDSVVLRLWNRADALLSADPQTLDISKLHVMFTEAHNLLNQARDVLRQCDAGKEFFAPANLALMALLPQRNDARTSIVSLTVDELDKQAAEIITQSGPIRVVANRLNKKGRDHYRRAGLKPPGW